MKVSLLWLKRFVNFKQSASELADLLTMLGFESEVVTDFSVLQNIVVGEETNVDAERRSGNFHEIELVSESWVTLDLENNYCNIKQSIFNCET